MEKNFLDAVTENFVEKLEDCQFSFYLSKKSMTICCEAFVLTNDAVDQFLEEHFFWADGLLQLGCRSNLC